MKNSIAKKVLTAASALAMGITAAAPAMAWHGWNEGYNPYGGGYYGAYPGAYVNPYYGGYGYRRNNGRRLIKTTLVGAGIGAAAGLGYGLLTNHRHRYGYWE